jgi:hypothetical protein
MPLESDVAERFIGDMVHWVANNTWQIQRMIQTFLGAPSEACIDILSRFFDRVYSETSVVLPCLNCLDH